MTATCVGSAPSRSHTSLSNVLAHRFTADALDDFAGEGVDQHPPRRFRPDAAGAQIENGFLVQLADGRAVRAFHVVGVNLQLRLGVGRRVVGEQQILVRLLGVGLLRARAGRESGRERRPSICRRGCR